MSRLRRALISLARSPGYVSIALPMLAVALGVATTVFAVVNAVMHPPATTHEPERLLLVSMQGDGGGHAVRDEERRAMLFARPGVFEASATVGTRMAFMETGNMVRDVPAARVSSNYFELLGTKAAFGRLFSPGTATSDAGGAVISYDTWRQGYGSRRSLAGLTIKVDAQTFEVIGVTPPGLDANDRSAVWTTAGRESTDRTAYWDVVARLRPSQTFSSAQRILQDIAVEMTAAYGVGRAPFRLLARPWRSDPLSLDDIHFALIAGAFAILMVTCGNLASLSLARGIGRQRDVAVRMAIGASRRSVMLDLMAESLVLSAAGSLLGLLLADWGLRAVQQVVPPNVPFIGQMVAQIDWRVVSFSALAAVGTAVFFGALPAWRATRLDISTPLKSGGGGATARTSWRYSPFVILELSLTLAVLTGALLLVRASARVRDVDFGFDHRSLVEAYVSTQRDHVALVDQPGTFFDDLVARAKLLPGVADAAWHGSAGDAVISSALFGGGGGTGVVRLEEVSPGYLRTMGIRVVAGRDFQPGDATGNGVVIFSERAASLLLHGNDGIGQQVSITARRTSTQWLPVVGIAGQVKDYQQSLDYYAMTGSPIAYIVRPYAAPWRELIVRSTPAAVPTTTLTLHRFLRDAVPVGAFRYVRPFREPFDAVIQAHQVLSWVFVSLGIAALLISAAGLFAVLAHDVGQRRRELAVRVALGAPPRRLIDDVSRRAAVTVLTGMAIGAFVAMWAGRFVDPFLFNMYRIDAWSLVVADVALMVATVLATLVPAYRAARANPCEAMRVD
ncbi:MAG: FtsX-like permease family protein [Gemmatimonadaceae bacterium]